MNETVDKIYDLVKDNTRELRYIKEHCIVVDARLDKNEGCHADLKKRINEIDLKINTIENEIEPMKKIMWIVLVLLITSVGGALLSLIFTR